jgi:hypothetical protein
VLVSAFWKCFAESCTPVYKNRVRLAFHCIKMDLLQAVGATVLLAGIVYEVRFCQRHSLFVLLAVCSLGLGLFLATRGYHWIIILMYQAASLSDNVAILRRYLVVPAAIITADLITTVNYVGAACFILLAAYTLVVYSFVEKTMDFFDIIITCVISAVEWLTVAGHITYVLYGALFGAVWLALLIIREITTARRV